MLGLSKKIFLETFFAWKGKEIVIFSNTSGEKEESLFQIFLWKLENTIFKLFPTIL